MNDHLSKPVYPDQLYACLLKWIRPIIDQRPSSPDERRPELPEHAIPASPQKVRIKGVTSARKILIVDDEPAEITLLRGMLPKQYQYMGATDGLTALELAQKHHPDLILLDVRMTGMDGYEICRALKENPDTAPTPVIFLTSLADTENIDKGFHMGAVDYVTKPFRALELNARVNTHLQLQTTNANWRG